MTCRYEIDGTVDVGTGRLLRIPANAVAPAADTPVMSPARCATQLIHAATHEPADVYRDLCATIAALATHSDVGGTARLLELLANAAVKENA